MELVSLMVQTLLIDNCTIDNCTRSNMPGSIDIEPNANAYHVVKNITISDIDIDNSGGNMGAITIGIPQPQTFYTTSINNINISNITVTNSINTQNGLRIYQAATTPVVSGTDDIDITVSNYTVTDCNDAPLYVSGVKDVSISGFVATDCEQEASIGEYDADRLYKSMNVTISSSTFTRCGATSGDGLQVWDVDGLTLSSVSLVDCGTGTDSNGLYFQTAESENVTLSNVTISSPTGQTTYGIRAYDALGTDLVTNGDFASDTWWDKSGESVIGGGVGSVISTAGAYSAIKEVLILRDYIMKQIMML